MLAIFVIMYKNIALNFHYYLEVEYVQVNHLTSFLLFISSD